MNPTESHPSRGAWIEINATKKNANDDMLINWDIYRDFNPRTPRGVRP